MSDPKETPQQATRVTLPARLFALAQLVRLPNVFTVVADVMMGFLLVHRSFSPTAEFTLLLAASISLYWAGMILNDFFDQEIDRAERPARPLPSGRISYRSALLLGVLLLAAGIALAGAAAWQVQQIRPLGLALLLAIVIILYDKVLKKTMLAPVAMGGCRFLNILLAASTTSTIVTGHYIVAAAIGIYIVGVTWFARNETEQNNRTQLLLSSLVVVAGAGLLAIFPQFMEERANRFYLTPLRTQLLFVALALLISRRCFVAVLNPQPEYVQQAVKHCITSLIMLDAGVVLVVCGNYYAAAVLLLLLPMFLLGHWFYST